RWLEALAHVAPPGASTFTTAELMVAWGREDYRRAVRIADELAALGEREALARASGRAAALMAWCYLMCARPDGAEDVLAIAEEGDEVRAAQYLLRVYMAEGRTPAPPQLSGGAFDALVLIGKYFSGRFLELLDAVPASRWVDSVTTPWRIGALRAAGRTQQALELYEAAQATGMTSLSLHTVVAPEVLLDAGRLEEAQEAIA